MVQSQRDQCAQQCLALVLGLLLCGQCVLAQMQFNSTTEVKLPKQSEVTSTFISTQEPFPGGAAAAAPNAAPGFAAHIKAVSDAMDGVWTAAQQRINSAFARAVGANASNYASVFSGLRSSTVNLLTGLEAARNAYEKTLQGYFGLLLDNTKELRKTLEDGNAVIDTINTLRGAECSAPSFTPPTAKPATISGAGASLSFTTGKCDLVRTAKPLQLDFKLSCNQPGISLTYDAPKYVSRFVAAAKAKTQECTVTRKYGVESKTTVTLFDPASFFKSNGEEETKDAGGEAKASDGASVTATTGKAQLGAGWYRTLFPVTGIPGDRVTFMPSHIRDTVEKIIKDITVDMSLNYTPFSLKHNLQEKADATAAVLSKYFGVKEKLFKEFKAEADAWLNNEVTLSKSMDFQGNLRDALKGVNITSMFDGLFARTASNLMANSKFGKSPGGGKMAAAAAGFMNQLSTERPLRTLLSRARDGAGQPISVKLNASLEEASKLRSELLGGVDLMGFLRGDEAMTKKGSLAEALLKDPQMGEKLKSLADTLQAVSAGMLRSSAAGAQRQQQGQQQPTNSTASASVAAAAG